MGREQEGEEMAIRSEDLQNKKQENESPQDRETLIRTLARKNFKRNDEAMRRLSKN